MKTGEVVIYSGNEWTVIDETSETLAVQNEYGELKIIPKAAAVAKYGNGEKGTFGWAVLAAVVLGLLSI